MKKFLVCISIIFSSILFSVLSVVPLTSSASDHIFCSYDENGFPVPRYTNNWSWFSFNSYREVIIADTVSCYDTYFCHVSSPSDLVIVENSDIGIVTIRSNTWDHSINFSSVSGTEAHYSYLETTDFRVFAVELNLKTNHVIFYKEDGSIYSELDVEFFHSNFLDYTLGLNVDVSFSPNLSGIVDRSVFYDLDRSTLSNTFLMTVSNNSSCGIQYDFAIYLSDQNTSRPGDFTIDSHNSHTQYTTRYDSDPVFVYYTSEECYSNVAESSQQSLNVGRVYNKPCQFHYLAPGASSTVTFNWSQINLSEDVQYIAVVRAVPNDYGKPSTHYAYDASEGDPDPGVHQIDGDAVLEVYHEIFSMAQYKDVHYDSSDSSNGVLPYDGSKGIDDQMRYQYSYDTMSDPQTGESSLKSVNIYDDPNSWFNKLNVPQHYSSDYLDSVGSSDSSYNTLFVKVSPVLSFYSSVFSFFPLDLLTVFNLGFWSIVIIAIIRRLK